MGAVEGKGVGRPWYPNTGIEGGVGEAVLAQGRLTGALLGTTGGRLGEGFGGCVGHAEGGIGCLSKAFALGATEGVISGVSTGDTAGGRVHVPCQSLFLETAAESCR